jgi:hypothetical protein
MIAIIAQSQSWNGSAFCRQREINFVADVVEKEEPREQSRNDPLAPGPAAFPRERREDKRQRDRESDRDEMGQPKRPKRAGGIHGRDRINRP